MCKRHRLTTILTILAVATTAVAAWQEDGYMPDVIAGHQYELDAAPDGFGGVIYAWRTYDGLTHHIYAQRVDARGEALWGAGGALVCNYEFTSQYDPVVAPDGLGGAFFAWRDIDSGGGTYWIYGQHLDASGAYTWPLSGVNLSTGATSGNDDLVVTPTDDDGAIFAWAHRTTTWDVHAMKVDLAGRAWANPVEVSAAANHQDQCRIVPRPGGGAIIAWMDSRDSWSDIYAHALDADGNFAWASEKIVCNDHTGYQWDMEAGTDGQGGAYVVWIDTRVDAEGDVYGLRLGYDGWSYGGNDGAVICSTTGTQADPLLAAAAGGTFVVWRDVELAGGASLYVQRLDYQLESQLTVNGRLFYDPGVTVFLQGVHPDGAGGLCVLWSDYSTSHNGDLHVNRLSSSGYTQWSSDGVTLLVEEESENYETIVPDGEGGLIAAWVSDERGLDGEIVLQRVERNGHWGYPSPEIASVVDAPADQGGQVILSWDASRLDPWPELLIQDYTLWRALPAAKAAGRVAAPDWAERLAAAEPPAALIRRDARDVYWELLEIVEAYGLPAYARTVATWADSVAGDPADHDFQVIAHGSGADDMWISLPATGRSVDNLAPETPLNLAGDTVYDPEGLDLSWSANTEDDLFGYAVHRGATADFEPGAGTLVASPADTTFFDDAWTPQSGWYYKVAALDVHGNVSGYALLEPDHVTGAEPLPQATVLRGNHPNPFNPSTTVKFDLAAPGHVRIEIYDAAGRLVRRLVDEARNAGRHAVTWDGRDDVGRPVASGVYLYRMLADRTVQTERMTLAR